MSSTATRRFKRKIERDKKKGKAVTLSNPYGEMELNVPSIDEVEQYILDKSRELRMEYKPTKIENNGLQL